MKTLNIKFYTLCLLLIFLFTTGMQCKKTNETVKEDVLPAETQTGKGTFGCLVNGEVWLPKAKFPYAGLTSIIQFGGFQIIASKGNQYISIAKNPIEKTGEFSLNAFEKDALFTENGIEFKCIEGMLTITKYDKINQIISGRFRFKAKSSTGEIIEITEGRFDDKYTN